MISGLPNYLIIIFLLTVTLTFALFVNASKIKSTVTIIPLAWLGITGILSFKGVFQNTDSTPPRLMIVMLPAIFFIILLFVTQPGRRFTDSLDLKQLTLVH